jgi:hypothetical protein
MAQVVNVKLKNGDDIVILENPVQIEADPEHGFFARSWLLLSDEDFVTLDKQDLFYIHNASDKSIGYYEDFVEKVTSKKGVVTDEDFTTDLEDVFNAIMDSRSAVKH